MDHIEKVIESKIYLLRGKKVILDRDLVYGVETKALKRTVKRNIERFPEDFIFELDKGELIEWRCKFGTSKSEKMGLRYAPMAFTEHGVAMLSSVLNSRKAIQVNILIVRAFIKMREIASTHKEIINKISEIETRVDFHDETLVELIEAVKKLLPISDSPIKKKIGF